MKDLTWYDIFIENLQEKFPKKTQLVEEIMNLLCIEREAVYRRLRREVVFPAHEVVKIASTWNISLDEITGINSGLIPFRLQPINFLSPSKGEMYNFQKRIKTLEHFSTSINSEYMEVGSKLPRPMVPKSTTLFRLKIFIWAFLYNTEEKNICLSDIILPENMNQEFEKYNKAIKNVTLSNFILDQKIFNLIVNATQYFHSILLITDEEKEIIKKELHSLLDYIMEIANTGYYPETQKKVNIYISHLNINTNYSYYYSDQIKTCRVHAFGKFDICSYNTDMVNTFRNWMNLKKRASIQISEVNERSRIEYIMKQREIVDTL